LRWLHAVGVGADKDAFENAARDLGVTERVRFVGARPARSGFALGRILVVPSRAESLPYIVLEAAARRKPSRYGELQVAVRQKGTTVQLQLTAEVTLQPTLLGGGFGRKSKCDFAIEAALLSKEMGGAPVKVVWTREDDIRHGFYHTVTAERFEAGLDAANKVIAWRHRSAAPSFMANFIPDPKHPGNPWTGSKNWRQPTIPKIRVPARGRFRSAASSTLSRMISKRWRHRNISGSVRVAKSA
jgi:hypothetical protein